MSFKISAIQMTSHLDVAENLASAKRLMLEAKARGAKLVVLPEMFAIMGMSLGDKVLHQESLGQGPIQNFLADFARTEKLWIIAGTIPITSPNPKKVYNTCLVYNDQGQCIVHYNKIHLYDVKLSETQIYQESASYEHGTNDEENIVVVDTPFGKIGLMVCYDIRFPELARRLLEKGAEILVAPSAFTMITGKAHWQILSQAVAVQNFCYFIGACQGGLHANGRETYGHSLIIDPWGTILAEAKDPQTETVLTTEIDLTQVSEARRKIPILEHRR